LRVKTIKGFGIKATEQNSAGGHGFPLGNAEKIMDWLREIYAGSEPPKELLEWGQSLRGDWDRREAEKRGASGVPSLTGAAVKKDKVQSGLAKAMIRAAQEGLPVYSISSDLAGSTGVSAFQKSLPDRHVDVGIAEANMVSVGAGFAKCGFIPVVDTFAQFGVTKGNLPLTMAALSQAPVIGVFSHAGFQDAADGASHQATTYFAAVCAIPRTVVVAPSCAGEAEALMYEAIRRYAADRSAGKDGESYLFFLGRESYPVQWLEKPDYAWGRAQIVREGSDVVLIGCGTLFGKALAAGQQLAERGISAAVINNPFVNRVDRETIGAMVRRCQGRVVTIEDHQVMGGMGALVSHALSQMGVAHEMRSLGIRGEFGRSAYVAEHLYELHGLTAGKMVDAAVELVEAADG
jgi:transketolase